MPPTAEERRQHQRYPIENSVSVTPSGIFQLLDISEGGFCFKCPPYTSFSETWKADILNPVKQLEGIPARRVWVSIPENGSHEILPIVVGAKFGSLTKEQNRFLSQVISEISQSSTSEQ